MKEVLDADFTENSENVCVLNCDFIFTYLYICNPFQIVAVTGDKCYAWSVLDKEVIFSIDTPILSKKLAGQFRFSR
jgi:hypothetical protein